MKHGLEESDSAHELTVQTASPGLSGIRIHSVSQLIWLFPLGGLLSVLLFLLLAKLISHEAGDWQSLEALPAFDFRMLRQESDVQRLKRELPQEPKVLPQPTLPQSPQNNISPDLESMELDMPTLDVPKIELGIQIDMRSALKGLSSAHPDTEMFMVDVPFDANPRVLTRTSPRYPSRALRRHIEGYVVVEFLVTPGGDVDADTLKIIESVPEGMFDNAVLRSIKRWKFQTKRQHGVAQPYRARQKVEFKLDS